MYKLTWDAINGENSSKQFHHFVQQSTTRWLVKYNVVKVILEHWFELKTHFTNVVEKEKCYKARILNQMLNDESNYLYLKIIKPILHELNIVNLSFQKENVDLGGAYDDLRDLIILLARKILKPIFISDNFEELRKAFSNELAYVSVNEADFGIEYYEAACYKQCTKDEKKTLKRGLTILLKN